MTSISFFVNGTLAIEVGEAVVVVVVVVVVAFGTEMVTLKVTLMLL